MNLHVFKNLVAFFTIFQFSALSLPRNRADTNRPKWIYSGKTQGDMVVHTLRSAINLEERRWPNGIICYQFEGNFSQYEIDIITEAMTDGFSETCLRLKNCRWKCGGDYVAIKNDEENCFTDVGRLGGRQEMNLGEGCVEHATVIHETMHAAGFYHEHSNPNRDQYLEIVEENIEPEMRHNFEIDDPEFVTDFGQPYDYCSIMHYDEHAFGIDGAITIIPKCDVPCEMGFAEELSDIDINKINIMYNCANPLREVSPPTGCQDIITTTPSTSTAMLDDCD